MIINGVNQGVSMPEKKPAVEEEELKKAVKAEIKEAIQQQEAQKEAKKEKFDPEKFKLDEYSLKELLFLMSSRGNTETIEKLAQILKKEKEEAIAKKK